MLSLCCICAHLRTKCLYSHSKVFLPCFYLFSYETWWTNVSTPNRAGGQTSATCTTSARRCTPSSRLQTHTPSLHSRLHTRFLFPPIRPPPLVGALQPTPLPTTPIRSDWTNSITPTRPLFLLPNPPTVLSLLEMRQPFPRLTASLVINTGAKANRWIAVTELEQTTTKVQEEAVVLVRRRRRHHRQEVP